MSPRVEKYAEIVREIRAFEQAIQDEGSTQRREKRLLDARAAGRVAWGYLRGHEITEAYRFLAELRLRQNNP